MIKGRYVATVIIDFHIDENQPGLVPFEKMKEEVMGNLSGDIRAMLRDEIGKEICTVRVEPQFSDLYQSDSDNA